MIEGLYEPFKTEWSTEGTVWLYSDPHFDEDEDLRIAFPHRPTAEEQVKMINSKVGKKDHLILLGDIGSIEWARKLRGHKILIAGNHDIGLSAYKDVFEYVYGGPLMISEKIILSHEPINVPYLFSIHGHNHNQKGKDKLGHLNCCSDVIKYAPINFNQFIKSGRLQEVESIHRITINNATLNRHGPKRLK